MTAARPDGLRRHWSEQAWQRRRRAPGRGDIRSRRGDPGDRGAGYRRRGSVGRSQGRRRGARPSRLGGRGELREDRPASCPGRVDGLTATSWSVFREHRRAESGSEQLLGSRALGLSRRRASEADGRCSIVRAGLRSPRRLLVPVYSTNGTGSIGAVRHERSAWGTEELRRAAGSHVRGDRSPQRRTPHGARTQGVAARRRPGVVGPAQPTQHGPRGRPDDRRRDPADRRLPQLPDLPDRAVRRSSAIWLRRAGAYEEIPLELLQPASAAASPAGWPSRARRSSSTTRTPIPAGGRSRARTTSTSRCSSCRCATRPGHRRDHPLEARPAPLRRAISACHDDPRRPRRDGHRVDAAPQRGPSANEELAQVVAMTPGPPGAWTRRGRSDLHRQHCWAREADECAASSGDRSAGSSQAWGYWPTQDGPTASSPWQGFRRQPVSWTDR